MMPISIEVIAYKGRPVSSPMGTTMVSGELSIGRRKENQLVLPDSEKFVSSLHASITSDDSTFYITDLSTNGLYINQSSQPIGLNNRIQLSNDDHLSMGEYELRVSISADESLLTPSVTDPTDLDDPFADIGAAVINQAIENDQSSSPDPDDPFADFSQSGNKSATAADHVSPIREAFNNQHEQSMNEVAAETPPVVDDPFGSIPENWMQEDQSPSKSSPPSNVASKKPHKPVTEETATVQMTVSEHQKHSLEQKNTSDAQIIQRFLAGAGISQEELGFDLSEESFETIGKLFRIAIQGLLDVMVSRSEIKNEFRLDVTTLRSVENNPVKFSLNADEAMIRLLSPNRPGYMSAEDAIEESFDDLRSHQLAVLSGMQKSLTDVLKLFNPDKLEKRLQKNNPVSASIPIHKRAKLWDLFEELYEEIEKEATDNFNELFGSSFADAYEKQTNQLKTRQDKYPDD